MKQDAPTSQGTEGWFHWRDEGDEIVPGLNIYRPSDAYSKGGILRLGAYRLSVRWSTPRQRFFVDLWRYPA